MIPRKVLLSNNLGLRKGRTELSGRTIARLATFKSHGFESAAIHHLADAAGFAVTGRTPFL